MTLTDAGPLLAVIDSDDSHHTPCVQYLARLSPPIVTTWPCFTEAMYLLGRSLIYSGQDDLWAYLERGLLQIHDLNPAERLRMRELMTKYSDTPMDLADASQVAAETMGVRRIFTVDSDFVVYRTAGKEAFEVLP